MQLNKFILSLCFFGFLIPGEFGTSDLVNHADHHLHIDGSSISLRYHYDAMIRRLRVAIRV